MKAWQSPRYGPPESMTLTETPSPTPRKDQVLLEVRGTAINPYDWHFLRGDPRFARLFMGLLRPKNTILGADVSGVVAKTAPNATRFKVGDEVFGECSSGAFAEQVCVSERNLAPKPAGLEFDEAAGLAMAGLTALQALSMYSEPREGLRVLINGASGGVGTCAVQIAKAMGAHVTGVSSLPNHELLRSLGADAAIDYAREDFTESGQTYNLICDAVGNYSAAALKKALAPNGVAAVVGFTSLGRILAISLQAGRGPRPGRPHVGLMSAKIAAGDLNHLKTLVEEGKLRPVIDSRFSFEDIPRAIARCETGRARGKVLVARG